MKIRPLSSLVLLLALALTVRAEEPVFPGLKSVLTEAEWSRSGLVQLTPDQLGVIDAALIRYFLRNLPPPATASTPTSASAPKASLFERFGLPSFSGDWRNQPPLVAKVTTWQGSNRFVLENGQVWQGLEDIPFELAGKTVTIEARPMNAFALKVGDKSSFVRVQRLK
jgi:hypothetical protein